MMKRMNKAPLRCAYCQGKLGLLVSRHWDLRFCSRSHKELYLNQALQRSEYVKHGSVTLDDL